jgi:DNA-binding response OmpR family regulator
MKRILVVDDESLVREALQRVLASDAYTVDIAPGGETALTEMRARPYDLAVVDVIMPGMDGVELIRRMRAEFPRVPVIAISGGGNFELAGYRPEAISTRAYLAAAGKAGAAGELAKPFDMSELEAMVQSVLENPGAAALN